MRGAAGNAVGLHHQHHKAMAGGDGGGAEAPETGTDHDQVGFAGATARSRFSAHRGSPISPCSATG